MFQVNLFDTKTLAWWNDERENIDFDPPYQRRGNIWSEQDKQYLIDSVLNGFDIPKIYIADFSYGSSTLSSSGKQYAIIDGKQRLAAIFDFFAGTLVLGDNFVWASDPKLKLAGLTYNNLVKNFPKVASKFANFSITVIRVITDEAAKINELFVRLNKGKALSGAELRNAMQGIVPDLIRAIASHTFFTDRISFSTSRKQSDNVAAKLLLLEFKGALTDTKKFHLDRLVFEGIQAEARVTEFNQAKVRSVDVLDKMIRVFATRDKLLQAQGHITIYYWLIRNANDDRIDKVRNFLVDFERQRKKNSRLAKTTAGPADLELLNFDLFDRSTNDQNSIDGRYNILRRRFDSWP